MRGCVHKKGGVRKKSMCMMGKQSAAACADFHMDAGRVLERIVKRGYDIEFQREHCARVINFRVKTV